MYTLYKFHFLNGISEINQLFDDILIIAPVNVYTCKYFQNIYCMCEYLYIHNKYTQYTHISKNVYNGCD